MQKSKEVIYSMLIENTGSALCDSGDAYGRHHEMNAKKSLSDFEREPSVMPLYEYELPKEGETVDSTDISPTVSVFHYLTSALEIDSLCERFNRLQCKEWDSEKAYGISEKQEAWLLSNNLSFGDTWNTYNGENNLSQVLQGCNMNITGNESNFEYPEYVLLQVHGGCDVRGGYTNAKLFKLAGEFQEGYINPIPSVFGTVKKKDGTEIQVETSYNGYSLTNEDGESVPIEYGDVISLSTN